jgi:5'-deoxynucleotidase YfbR-like HD superfamily hydrolase
MLPVLVELQRLKRLERTGWSLRGMPNGTESVASHSFGVSIAAMLLADELVRRGVAIDVERVLKLALLHDWPEARVGDMPRTAISYFGLTARKLAESRAFSDIADSLNNCDLYRDLHQEYEQRETLEARLVKAADVIDLLVQALALERAGARGLDEFWEVASDPDFRLEGSANELVSDILRSLLEERRELLA